MVLGTAGLVESTAQIVNCLPFCPTGGVCRSWRVWRGLRPLLRCLACDHAELVTLETVPLSGLLAAQRLCALVEALVRRRADPFGTWGLHWQDAASCSAMLAGLPRPAVAARKAAPAKAATALLRLLSALRGDAGGRARQCVLRCLEVLALHWSSTAEEAGLRPASSTELLSCLEAMALCASGTLALLDCPQLARHSQSSRLEQSGLAFTGMQADALRLMKLGAPWCSTAGEQRERLVAAALAAGEAIVRLVGRIVQEEAQLEALPAVVLTALVNAAHMALDIVFDLMRSRTPGSARPLLRTTIAASAAASASKLVMAVLHASPAR